MSRSLDSLRVLIIEDQREVRQLLRSMLKELRIDQVFEAANGREGLRFLDDAPEMVDVVVCDWNMPGMSGIELLRQLRTVSADLPFVMITGRADRTSVLEAKAAGVNSYISKPFSLAQVEAKLRALLAAVERRETTPA